MKVEEESAKTGVQLNIKNTKIMTTELYHLSTDNENTEIVRDFVYLGFVYHLIIRSNGD